MQHTAVAYRYTLRVYQLCVPVSAEVRGLAPDALESAKRLRLRRGLSLGLFGVLCV